MSTRSRCILPAEAARRWRSSKGIWRAIRTTATRLLALISYSRDAGDFASALEYARRLARVAPNDPGLAGLIDDLTRRANAPRAP